MSATAVRRLMLAAPVLAAALAPRAASAQAADSMLVSAAWLAEHAGDRDLVVLHASNTRRDYLNGHVPGARFIWTGSFAPSTPDLSTELPNVAQIDSALEAAGVSDRSRIVIYGPNGPMTARLFLTLEWLGAGARTSILDGGIAGWKAAGQPVSTETPSVARGRFTPRPSAVTVDAAYVRERIGAGRTRIVDARDRQFYEGQGGGMPRPGHIPTALSIPYVSLLTETGAFKPREALREAFTAAGLQPGDPVVTYCHVGQQASLVWFVARMLGHDARLYDGSFEDWSGRAELPLEGPVKK